MKKILALLLFPVLSFGQTYTQTNSGSSNYHEQRNGGIGADKTLRVPVTDVSSISGFTMKGLLKMNQTGGYLEYHDGTNWVRLVDPAYATSNYYPLSGNPSGFLTSFTETDPTVPAYSKTLNAFSVIKSSTDPLYKPIGYTPTPGEITTALGFTPYNSTNPNSYINQSQARSVISLTTTGSGAATYNSSTGQFNVPTPSITTYTAGSGINIAAGAISNTAPDQTVTLTGSNGITTGGTYPNFTISRKRQETYSGTTIAAGTYTVTFGTAYSVAPNVQANIINGTDTQNIRITSISTTGFTVLVRNRTDVVGLLPSWSNVSGANVDVLITEK